MDGLDFRQLPMHGLIGRGEYVPKTYGMRTADNNVRIVEHDGALVGIMAGTAECSEMEHGIQGIQRAFGVLGRPTPSDRGVFESLIGADIRKVRQIPDGQCRLEGWGLYFTDGSFERRDFAYLTVFDQVKRRDMPFLSAWGENAFAFAFYDHEIARKLYTAILSKDALIFLTGEEGDLTGNSSLAIFIASATPSEWLEELAACDRCAVEELMKVRETWSRYHGRGFHTYPDKSFGYI